MPLVFESLSHGTIAFGFFNIDSDMLLLEQYFLFGSEFSRKTFQELITYVWRGGYPRWRDGIRPDYVLDMKSKIEAHRRGLFEKIQFG